MSFPRQPKDALSEHAKPSAGMKADIRLLSMLLAGFFVAGLIAFGLSGKVNLSGQGPDDYNPLEVLGATLITAAMVLLLWAAIKVCQVTRPGQKIIALLHAWLPKSYQLVLSIKRLLIHLGCASLAVLMIHGLLTWSVDEEPNQYAWKTARTFIWPNQIGNTYLNNGAILDYSEPARPLCIQIGGNRVSFGGLLSSYRLRAYLRSEEKMRAACAEAGWTETAIEQAFANLKMQAQALNSQPIVDRAAFLEATADLSAHIRPELAPEVAAIRMGATWHPVTFFKTEEKRFKREGERIWIISMPLNSPSSMSSNSIQFSSAFSTFRETTWSALMKATGEEA